MMMNRSRTEIRVLKNRLNLTYLELGHLIGVDGTTVSRWARGLSEPRDPLMVDILLNKLWDQHVDDDWCEAPPLKPKDILIPCLIVLGFILLIAGLFILPLLF